MTGGREIIAVCCFISIAASIFITREIEANQQTCLSEDIPRHTLIKIDVKTQGSFQFDFKEGMMTVFTQDIQNMGFTKSLTTQRYGSHHFCFFNKGLQKSKIGLQIAIGKHANDYGSAVGGDDLIGALGNQAKIAQEFVNDIVKQNTQGMEIMVAESRQKYSFTNLYIFSGIFVMFSLLLTFLQYKAIKKYLHTRKYI